MLRSIIFPRPSWLSIRLREVKLRAEKWLRFLTIGQPAIIPEWVTSVEDPSSSPCFTGCLPAPTGINASALASRRFLSSILSKRNEEAAGILPQERNGVAIDVRHHETGKLCASRLVGGTAILRETALFVERELIHRRKARRYEVFARGYDRYCRRHWAVFIGTNQKWLDVTACSRGSDMSALQHILLGRQRGCWPSVNSIGAGSEIMIERFILVEDHKDIFYCRAKAFDASLPWKVEAPRPLPMPVPVKR